MEKTQITDDQLKEVILPLAVLVWLVSQMVSITDTKETVDFIRKYIDELLKYVSGQELLNAECSA